MDVALVLEKRVVVDRTSTLDQDPAGSAGIFWAVFALLTQPPDNQSGLHACITRDADLAVEYFLRLRIRVDQRFVSSIVEIDELSFSHGIAKNVAQLEMATKTPI